MSDNEEPESNGGALFEPVMPFWIDTDAYSDRDRLMFVCGYEFAQTHARLNSEIGDEYHRPIHRENESRMRMMCAKLGRQCEIEPWESPDDPDGTWSFLTVAAQGESSR